MKKKQEVSPKGLFWTIVVLLLIILIGYLNPAEYSREQRSLDALQSASDAKDAKCRSHPEWC